MMYVFGRCDVTHTSFPLQVSELRAQHQSELLAQIATKEEKRKLERAAVREAGRQAAKQSAEYIAKIEHIKQRKLKELEQAGVPAKYCAECAPVLVCG
jgi:hypothetical protein